MAQFTSMTDVHDAVATMLGDASLLHPAIDVAWIAEQMEAAGLLVWRSGEDEDGTIWLNSQGWDIAEDSTEFWAIVERADDRAATAHPHRLHWLMMQDTGEDGDMLIREVWGDACWFSDDTTCIMIEPSEDLEPYTAAEDEMLSRLGLDRGEIAIITHLG